MSACDWGCWGMGIGMIDGCGAYCPSRRESLACSCVWSCGLLRVVLCWDRARIIKTLAPLGATMRATIVAALIASRPREPGSCCLTATDARFQREPTSPTTITAKVGPPAAGRAAETIARGCGAPVTKKRIMRGMAANKNKTLREKEEISATPQYNRGNPNRRNK